MFFLGWSALKAVDGPLCCEHGGHEPKGIDEPQARNGVVTQRRARDQILFEKVKITTVLFVWPNVESVHDIKTSTLRSSGPTTYP